MHAQLPRPMCGPGLGGFSESADCCRTKGCFWGCPASPKVAGLTFWQVFQPLGGVLRMTGGFCCKPPVDPGGGGKPLSASTSRQEAPCQSKPDSCSSLFRQHLLWVEREDTGQQLERGGTWTQEAGRRVRLGGRKGETREFK